MEIVWVSSVPASALYAASAMLRGRTLVEPDLAAALRPAVTALADSLTEHGSAAECVLRQLVPLAASYPSSLPLAEAVLGNAVGKEPADDGARKLAEAITKLLAALAAARPRLAEELPLRVEPLRSQWEARGPGLLAGVRRLTAGDLLVPAAGLTLVQPILAGGGESHPEYDCVTFEAVLANPIARLPEVLRLGWLLAQLNFDLPAYGEGVGRERLQFAARLALVPVVLAAAEDVELAHSDAEHLRLALSEWLSCPELCPTLTAWWETYRETRPAWPVGLTALAAMLAGAKVGRRKSEVGSPEPKTGLQSPTE
jgi:hypothetical protein